MARKPTFAVDLDATLAAYDKWRGLDHIGEPIEGAVEFVNKLAEVGRIVIYTNRMNYRFNNLSSKAEKDGTKTIIKNWLESHNIKYDEIYCSQGKPVAHAYIDDRSVECRPQEDDKAYEHAYELALKLAKIEIVTEVE
jgi:hypothetical protein